MDEGDAERGGFEPGLSEMGKEGREFIGAEIAPLGVPVFLGPWRKLVERLADRELIG